MPITIALVGRTNVGKSTLFNYLTHTKNALTGDVANLTRDRRYGSFQFNNYTYTLIDTGGLETQEEPLTHLIQQQTHKAIADSDYIGFVVDAQQGLTAQDETLAAFLRGFNKPIILIINKVERRVTKEMAIAEFSTFGFSVVYPVSALQRSGFAGFFHYLNGQYQLNNEFKSIDHSTEATDATIQLTIIGKPNAGKSTLVNRLLGEDRQIVSDIAGTTRDSMTAYFQKDGQAYHLVDTAGIRRLANVISYLEKSAVDQSLHSLKASAVVILMIDATLGLTDQDLHLLKRIVDARRAVVMLCNKWDQLDTEAKLTFQKDCKWRLRFIPFLKLGFISSLYGTGVHKVLALVKEAYTHATKKLSTSKLTQLLEEALKTHAPPRVNRRSIKLRYAHPGGYNPPTIIIHGTHVSDIPHTYKRYLDNFYRNQLNIVSTPLKIEFREKRSSK